MVFFRWFIATSMVILGFVIYPYYLDYIITPISAIATTLDPNMNLFEQAYINLLPFIVLLLILFFGIMHLLGKAGGGDTE